MWESKNTEPLIDLSLFRSRNYSVGVALVSLGMMLYLATVVLLPLLLQSRFGYTATWAGLATAPVGFFPVLLTPVVGRLAGITDVRRLITFSFGVFASVLLYRSNFSPQADLRFVVVPQFVMGLAMSCFFVPITSLAFIGLDPAKIASASGIFNCVRTIFAAIGTSASITMWERREAFHHVRLTAMVDPYNLQAAASMDSLAAMGMGRDQVLAFVDRQITNQGFILAGAEIFKLCGLFFLAMIPLIWLARPNLRGGGPPGRR